MLSAPQGVGSTAFTRTVRAQAARYRHQARRHDEAVIQAEVRRLARTLRPYGVLHRDALEQAADADRWREGAFETALTAAVRRGVIERLPEGFYRTAESDDPSGN